MPKRSLTTFPIFPMIALACAIVTSTFCWPGHRSSVDPKESSPLLWEDYVAMAEQIEELPLWSDRQFTDTEWQEYLRAARMLQRLSNHSRECVLVLYMARINPSLLLSTTKVATPYILARLMYELPSDEPDRVALRKHNVSFLAGVLWPKPLPGQDPLTHITMDFPVRFDETGPNLMAYGALVGGGAGDPRGMYEPHLEDRYFREHFTTRDLEPFIIEQIADE